MTPKLNKLTYGQILSKLKITLLPNNLRIGENKTWSLDGWPGGTGTSLISTIALVARLSIIICTVCTLLVCLANYSYFVTEDESTGLQLLNWVLSSAILRGLNCKSGMRISPQLSEGGNFNFLFPFPHFPSLIRRNLANLKLNWAKLFMLLSVEI